ncbi:hypothetical protein PHIM7_346 [Sinorhizobium phage phiM7]|uniref:Uncharacterized protein n=2 Tax=Emdodecavirus TaxID=1980937 RepID=S5M7L4_9CAUD|nr:hypothetical protein AB690_gp169 [Sinorhizobium phage phiM12]YP_009601471.1 hypothetical protein FDH46_gp132 [Sinorhizobium phage phiM7]AGR48076.1 hypothetical protein SmphiM12_444 [Sinorhizobium phage phiM12]AKF12891.1 hypothetical protein PHIM7_346 [Sinorhizobium phage phiM7]AKF13251.1 hypothetical protein PHIM19_346 [Sinorhizobium phage phiM19]
MLKKVNKFNENDKLLIAAELATFGIKYRFRKFPSSYRLVFVGDWKTVCDILNRNGILNAGAQAYTQFSFQDIDPKHGEVFLYYTA